MADALATNATRFIFREFVVDVVFFPVWWYGKGLIRVGRFVFGRIAEFTSRSRWSPKVWFQNIFVPMYGDYSRSGRAISFFVRLVVALALSVVLVLATITYLVLLVLYLVAPLAVAYFVLRQFFGVTWIT